MDKVSIEQHDIYVPDGVIIIDHGGKIVAFNEAARRITGYEEEDVSLRDYQLLFKDSTSDQTYIDKALKNVPTEDMRQYYVIVNEEKYPPKQVLAHTLKLGRVEFTTMDAASILRRLGFKLYLR